MSVEKRPSFKRTRIYLMSIVGAVSAIIFIRYFYIAFPHSRIPLSIDKREAVQIARSFLTDSGHEIDGYNVSVSFETDDEVDGYLQRTIGIERLNELTEQNAICIHYFRVRFYKPGKNEEFVAGIAPNGTIDGFRRYVSDDISGSSLSVDEANARALEFISDSMGEDVSAYELLSTKTNDLANRTDHSFVWSREWDHDADVLEEIMIHIHGDKIGLYEKYLKVPEIAARGFKRQSEYGSLLQTISRAATVFLLFCAIAIIIHRVVKKGYVIWRFAIIIGACAFVVSMLLGFNKFSILAAQYSTTSDWWVFVLKEIFSIMIGAIATGMQVFIFSTAGFSLLTDQSSQDVESTYSRRDSFEKLYFGYVLAFVLLAFHTIYYLIVNSRGAWLPAKPRFSNTLLAYLPTFSIVGSSIIAALTEEIPFRLFAIPFLKRVTRSTLIALILPAIIWASLHAGHTVHPFYLRIIELTIVGVIYGLFFIRYGFFACFVAHYLVNALAGPMIFIEPKLPLFTITMGFAFLLPTILVVLISVNSKLSNAAVKGLITSDFIGKR